MERIIPSSSSEKDRCSLHQTEERETRDHSPAWLCDAVYVVDERYRKPAMTANGWANANLRTELLRLLKKARIEPWPRLFHNLRATRETELVAHFPIHVVAHWLGNTPDIAMRHYLLVTEGDFAKAACIDQKSVDTQTSGAESGAVLAQHTSAPICTGRKCCHKPLPSWRLCKRMRFLATPCLPPNGGGGN